MMDEHTPEHGGDTEQAPTTAPLPSQVARPKTADPTPVSMRSDGPSPSEKFGRIDADGNVFVLLPDGNESFVGQWAAGDPDEGLRMYARRFDDLVVDVDLAGRRMAEGRLSPDEAQRTVDRVREALLHPTFIGDLAGLADRVRQLEVLIGVRRETLAEAAAAAKATAAERRAAIVASAEQLATSTDWRRTQEKFRALVDEWKTLPRFDRDAEQEQWQRLSTARSAFDKARRTHFAAQEKQHAAAKAAKEKLIAEAEALSGSTDWNATSTAYRELMERWKKAGFAGKPEDDKLWKRFRAAQDVFFAARKAQFDARDNEQRVNLSAKRDIVTKAEALLPVTDAKKARRSFRALQGEFAAIGHVPRADKPKLDARMRKVDDAISASENDAWRKSDPERNARAQMMVTLYEKSVAESEAKLAAAQSAGADTAALEADLQAKRELLEAARRYA